MIEQWVQTLCPEKIPRAVYRRRILGMASDPSPPHRRRDQVVKQNNKQCCHKQRNITDSHPKTANTLTAFRGTLHWWTTSDVPRSHQSGNQYVYWIWYDMVISQNKGPSYRPLTSYPWPYSSWQKWVLTSHQTLPVFAAATSAKSTKVMFRDVTRSSDGWECFDLRSRWVGCMISQRNWWCKAVTFGANNRHLSSNNSTIEGTPSKWLIYCW